MGEHEIVSIRGREVLDSRGNPTVEADVVLESGAFGRAAVPSGASTGSREAIELRDGDKGRYLGKGVTKAVDAVNGEIADAVTGFDALDQTGARHGDDRARRHREQGAARRQRDPGGQPRRRARPPPPATGLPLYRYLGGVGARVLPTPMMNIINGGAHADNPLDIQEFMILPVGRRELQRGAARRHRGVPRAEEAAQGRRPQHRGRRRGRLRAQRQCRAGAGLHREGRSPRRATSWARISCWASTWPPASSSRMAATELEGEGKTLDPDGMVALARGPVRAVPDRLDRGRHGRGRLGRLEAADRGLGRRRSSWSATTCSSPTPRSWPRASTKGIANAILIKVNQIGTLTETLDAIRLATAAGYSSIISHRSGETEDSTIADLAVATNCGQIKTGSLSRSDRLAKYNQLLADRADAGRRCRLCRAVGAWRAAEAKGAGWSRNLIERSVRRGSRAAGWRSWSRPDPRLFRLPRAARPLRVPGLDRHQPGPRGGAAGAGAAQGRARGCCSATSQLPAATRSIATCSRRSCASWAMSKPNEVIILRRDEEPDRG